MEQERHFAHSIEELRDDLKGFIETRYEILRADLRTGLKRAQGAAVLVGAAIVLAMVGILLLAFCAALAVALAFGALANHAGLVWGFLIIGGAAVLLGAGAGMAARERLKTASLKPKRTLFVLGRDKQFLQRGGQEYGDSARFRRQA
jgi:Putative Actinobacterial Holin-X, holin superfamily III